MKKQLLACLLLIVTRQATAQQHLFSLPAGQNQTSQRIPIHKGETITITIPSTSPPPRKPLFKTLLRALGIGTFSAASQSAFTKNASQKYGYKAGDKLPVTIGVAASTAVTDLVKMMGHKPKNSLRYYLYNKDSALLSSKTVALVGKKTSVILATVPEDGYIMVTATHSEGITGQIACQQKAPDINTTRRYLWNIAADTPVSNYKKWPTATTSIAMATPAGVLRNMNTNSDLPGATVCAPRHQISYRHDDVGTWKTDVKIYRSYNQELQACVDADADMPEETRYCMDEPYADTEFDTDADDKVWTVTYQYTYQCYTQELKGKLELFRDLYFDPNADEQPCTDCPPPDCYSCTCSPLGCDPPPPANPVDSTKNIVDSLHNHCLDAALNMIKNPALTNSISTLLKTMGINDNFTVIFAEVLSFPPHKNQVANTSMTRSGPYTTLNLTFSLSQMQNSSQEYKVETMLHEIIHAHMNTLNPHLTELEQHELMYSQGYLDMEIAALREIFPSLSLADATSIIIGGYGDLQQKNNALFQQILTAKGLTENGVKETNDDYRHGAKGKHCVE